MLRVIRDWCSDGARAQFIANGAKSAKGKINDSEASVFIGLIIQLSGMAAHVCAVVRRACRDCFMVMQGTYFFSITNHE